MKHLDDQKQIDAITKDNWQKLFNLVPEIEKNDKFGVLETGGSLNENVHFMSEWNWSDITSKFVELIYELKLVLNFDWGKWSEGQEILKHEDQDFKSLDNLTLCKLITMIVRADRFADGFLISNFENGKVLKILKALENNNINSMEHNQTTPSGKLTEKQEQFIWLAHAEGKKFSEIEKILGLPRSTISDWEVRLKPAWQEMAAIKKLYAAKGIKLSFRSFYDWMIVNSHDKKCTYCKITEPEIQQLYELAKRNGGELTVRKRGPKLELDRKKPKTDYDDLENIVWACYWCNNAKTDTFTHEEFLQIGKTIEEIWKKRLGK